MSIHNRIDLKKVGAALGFLVLCIGLTGESCTPDRTVEVVIAADLIADFHAQGSDNTYSGETTIDVSDQIDIQEIMDDNGLEEITEISVQSVFLKTTVKDGAPNRTVSGTVDVRRGGGADAALVAYSSAEVNSVEYEDWVAIPLETPGVTILNDAFADIIGGAPVSLTFTASGTSTPIDTATDFWWQAKLRVNVVGTKKVTVFEPL
jgi:hypothetical protein